MAFGFPAYHTARYCACTTDSELHTAVIETLKSMPWTIQQETSAAITAKSKTNLRSWGERILVTFLPDSSISVRSRCAAPTQCLDWGKNKANVKKFLAALSGRVRASGGHRTAGDARPLNNDE